MPKPVSPQVPQASNERLMLNIALKAGAGLVASGLIALLAARKSGGRLFITGLGTGSGLGYGWCQNDVHLKHPDLVSLPESAQTEFNSYYAWCAGKIPSFAKFK